MNDIIVTVDRIHKRGRLFFFVEFCLFVCSLFFFKHIGRSVNCDFIIPRLVLREFGASSSGDMRVEFGMNIVVL